MDNATSEIRQRRNRARTRALALFGACLVALCAWLLVRPASPTSVASELSGGPAVRIPDPEAPPEAAAAAAEPFERSSAAEPLGPAVPPLAVVAKRRLETRVRGALLDTSDAPIQGAWSASVSFVDHSGLRRTSDASSEGAYELRELEFGTYWVTASADGYLSLEEEVELRPNQRELRKDFTLRKAVELRVRVSTPEGKDLLEVLKQGRLPSAARSLLPVATREPPGKRFEDVAGNLNAKLGVGQFQDHGPRVEALPQGCLGLLLLDCDLPVSVSLVYHHVVLQTKLALKGQDEVEFVLSADELFARLATIRVCVIDAETRQPLERARVLLSGGSYSSEGVATDAQGVAAIAGREPGLFDLQIWANGYESLRKPIDALPGEITDLGTLALDKEVSVEGRILDLEGHPRAASFVLGVVDPLDRVVHWSKQPKFSSGGDGCFTIRGLGRREYVVRTGNHDALDAGEWQGITWVSGNLLLDTRAGPISGLELRLRPASRLVLHTSARAGDGLGFRVVDASGLELVAGRLQGTKPRALELPMGTYLVTLLARDGSGLSECSTTLGAEPMELALVP